MTATAATERSTAIVKGFSEPAAEQVRGARILLEGVVREGVDTIFGYPGGAVLHIYDELARMPNQLRHILARHEQGAVHMAEGYSKATGQVGVVLVTSGPGATNAVTGIANAFMDSTPLVVITGQVPRKLIGTDAFQEIDTVGITRPCTKHNYLVRDVNELAEVVHEAFYIARTGRPGPVVIDIPKDVSAEIAPLHFEKSAGPPVGLPGYCPHTQASARQVEQAVDRIIKAQRPILYVGGGVIHSNGSDELLELAARLNLPVTPTLMGLGCFPSGHPLSLGMLGMHGTYWANMAISESDVIIAIGVRFDDRVTGALEKFAPQAQIVHVDVDPSSVSKNVRAHLPVVGDAKMVMCQMLDCLRLKMDRSETAVDCGDLSSVSFEYPTVSQEQAKAVTSPRTPKRLAPWWKQIDEWKQFAPLAYEQSADVIKPQLLCQELHRLTGGDAIIATDVGQHQMWLAQYYGFKGPRQSLTSGGLGAMGFGFPAALGAQLAFPDRQVIAFVGDGGFQMTAQELATAVQYRTNTKIIVMNNNYLGMVRQWQEIFYDKTYSAVDMKGAPDFVKLAEAYGAVGLRATKPAQLTAVLEQGLATKGVVVMDIVVSAEENVFPMIPPGAGLKEMVLR